MLRLRQLTRNALAAAALFYVASAAPLRAQGATGQVQFTPPASTVSVSTALAQQTPFLGSVPTGQATGTVISLSLNDALDRGLKYNLGLIESDLGTRTARAERLKSLNELLPNINAAITQSADQVNLRAEGLNSIFRVSQPLSALSVSKTLAATGPRSSSIGPPCKICARPGKASKPPTIPTRTAATS